ncbi:hypothetical protein [Bradyrhizobium sp. AUGA SZCCT0431]|uniref:hypothetical protein n=1 Tax=Bradyrhizobium sp. AUGA SZCCT0431 TaxID=2807674 RepID=UPI001BAAF698|nr:hypothetical protein [Bradyrhizobium sp. AUGA SZCCT0431]MBR1146690.1 hypothetical protein [Bradyrhizobium sp. AUGA SZCCT0431]
MPDFQKLKNEITITQCLALLGVAIPQGSKAQLKLDCPKCGGKNNLAVNTDRNIAFCHTAKAGGDILSLVSHVKELSLKEAADWLSKPNSPALASKRPQDERNGFKPLEGLEADHPAVEVTGLDPFIAARAGIGYANKGVLKGTIAVPVWDMESGQLLGYIGCVDFIVPVSLRGENIVEIKRDAS